MNCTLCYPNLDNTTRELSSAEPTPSQHAEEPEQNRPPPPPAPPLPKPFDYKNSAPKAPSKVNVYTHCVD